MTVFHIIDILTQSCVFALKKKKKKTLRDILDSVPVNAKDVGLLK